MLKSKRSGLFRLDELDAVALASCGGKVLGLYQLTKLGYQVPATMVVMGFDEKSWGPESAQREKLAQWMELKPAQKKWVVRSSASVEDSADKSCAGQFLSILGLETVDEVIQAIRQVLASRNNSHLASYLSFEERVDLQMSVIVQPELPALTSGVAFGLNPLTGNQKEVWISMTEGLGDQLLAGHESGQEYLYSSDAKFVEPMNGTLKESPPYLSSIVSASQDLALKQNRPQDLEWVWDGNLIWFVQMRPVTRLTNVSFKKASAKTVFDNSNIQESFSGVTTPLTFSYAVQAYFEVYTMTLRSFGAITNQLHQSRQALENMLGLVDGRIYYNIRSWYEVLCLLPSFKTRKAEMEEMMGLKEPVEFIRDRDKTFFQQAQHFAQMCKVVIQLVIAFIRLPNQVRQFDLGFWKIYQTVPRDELNQVSNEELVPLIRKLQADFLKRWNVPIVNDIHVMILMGQVSRFLKKHSLESLLGHLMVDPQAEPMESLKPTIELQKIAQKIQKNSELKELFETLASQDLVRVLPLIHLEFWNELENFRQVYGDRSRGELKLETITMRLEPKLLVNLLKNFVLAPERKSEPAPFSYESLKGRLHFLQIIYLKNRVKALQKASARRELLRFHRTRNFGIMRDLYLEVGRRLQALNFINHYRDIFFLTQDEIFSLHDGRSVTLDLKSLIELRKKEFEMNNEKIIPGRVEKNWPPSLSQQDQLKLSLKSEQGTYRLKGLAVSTGVVEGFVCIANETTSPEELRGKILVAERTDPGWTPLFALVRGVIVAKGSMLSHSAVIAREMGIPAIVAVDNLLQVIKDGDYVRIFADQEGIIEINAHSTHPLAENTTPTSI